MDTPSSPMNSQSGDDQFEFYVRAIRIGLGDRIELTGPSSIVVIVGTNNAGKSTFLQELRGRISQQRSLGIPLSSKVISEAELAWRGNDDAMRNWVESSGRFNFSKEVPAYENKYSQLQRSRRTDGTAGSQWHWLVNEQTPALREKVCEPVPRLNSIADIPTHPYHSLLIDYDARERVKEISVRIFQQPLEFDSVSGKIGFHVGTCDTEAPPIDNVTKAYFDELSKLPPLHDQGDGMKAALGLVIPLITEQFPVNLIDEPEAFLHPPQARYLGNEVGRLAHRNRSQTFLATHDKNFLQGLIEGNSEVSIIHLTRSGDSASGMLLDANQVRELWEDPLLRYGNVLEGLFHAAVIITEGDRDSQFYEAAIDSILLNSKVAYSHNLMFVGAHGKTNMAPIVERLRKLGIKSVTTPDLDILNDAAVLRRLVEASGGTWNMIEPVYKRAVNQFSTPQEPPRIGQVRQLIDSAIGSDDAVTLTKAIAHRVREVVTLKSRWSTLKTAGDRAFQQDKSAANSLLEMLDNLGIVAVRVGELEQFLTTADASKGPGFLKVAFAEDAHKSPAAASHASRLLRAAGITTE